MKLSNRYPPFAYLLAVSGFCCLLVLIRVYFTQNLYYIFLIWNLFLAWLPLVISKAVDALKSHTYFRLIFISTFPIWLVFFPNALYLITDIVHFKFASFNIYFDGVMFFSFAVAGTFCGVLSLYYFERTVLEFGKQIRNLLMPGVIIASSYGIYVGRIQRWNSWDIFIKPWIVIPEMLKDITTFDALLFTFLFSAILIFVYVLIISLIKMERRYDPKDIKKL